MLSGDEERGHSSLLGGPSAWDEGDLPVGRGLEEPRSPVLRVSAGVDLGETPWPWGGEIASCPPRAVG